MGEPMIEFYMARHGEALHNLRPELINGQSRHAPLSPEGARQATDLGEHLKRIDMRPDLVLVSPAQRCQQTAKLCLEAMGCDIEPVFDERLLELSQGKWEGQPRGDIYTEEVLERIGREQMDFCAPGGQSINQVASQQSELFDELSKRSTIEAAGEDPTIILGFGHGLATRIRAGKILGWTMGEMRREITPNASITLFTHDGNEWDVEYVGKLPVEMESRTIIGT